MTTSEQISTKAAEVAMSAAQMWINEGINQGLAKGIQQGIERGIEQGIERGVRGMLKLGMNAATIATALDMPQANVERLIEKIRSKKE